VSNAGGEDLRRSRPAAWDRLELSVRRLLDDYQLQRGRADRAEERIAELEAALETLSGGGPDPIVLREQVTALETENRALRERLDRARQEVERIMARLQFLDVTR
jgi:predicted nuclease with TOPRIM domain